MRLGSKIYKTPLPDRGKRLTIRETISTEYQRRADRNGMSTLLCQHADACGHIKEKHLNSFPDDNET